MTCFNPITAYKKRWSSLTDTPEKYYRDKKIKFKEPKDIENYEKIKIPCGRCLGCRLDHSNMWSQRIFLESKRHKDNCFITLTYDNKHLPLTETNKMTLRKKDFQDFMKRLRYYTKKKILYFGAGEYGPTTYRPHGHFLIMGWKPNDLKTIQMSKTNNQMYTSKTLEKIWGKGYITVEELNYKTACYTARYVQKKSGIKPNKRILSNQEPELTAKEDERTGKYFLQLKNKYITEKTDMYGREKEFLLMSKKPAIGLTYWEKNKDTIKKTGNIVMKIEDEVKIKPIPRYFMKKWEKEDMSEFETSKYHSKINGEEKFKENLKKISAPENMKESMYYNYLKNNLEFKGKFLKRNQV